jgi:hypothetical protein
VLLLAVAAWFGLLVGITVCALFFRPPVGAVLDRAADWAFYTATFLLGLLLVAGVNLLAGLLLGVSVFVVQGLVAWLVTRGLPGPDRVHLALGQQNGLTAIVLGLALQPYVPQAVGIIAIAILTVNVLHICGNTYWDLELWRPVATRLKCLLHACHMSKPVFHLPQVPETHQDDVALRDIIGASMADPPPGPIPSQWEQS